MEHIYTIPFVRTVEERSGLNKVALSATVYINTQETFEHTFEKQEYDMKRNNKNFAKKLNLQKRENKI